MKSSLSLLTQYSSSDEENEGNEDNCKRRKIELPSSIKSLFQDKAKEDNPADHQGRTRSFPHVRGNWASYIYIIPNGN